jgi:hypothetical protein
MPKIDGYDDALLEKMGIGQRNSRGELYVHGLRNLLMLIEGDIRYLEKHPDEIADEAQAAGEALGFALSQTILIEHLRPDSAAVSKHAKEVRQRIDDLIHRHPEVAYAASSTLKRNGARHRAKYEASRRSMFRVVK